LLAQYNGKSGIRVGDFRDIASCVAGRSRFGSRDVKRLKGRPENFLHRARLAHFCETQVERLRENSRVEREYQNRFFFRAALQDHRVEILNSPRNAGNWTQRLVHFFESFVKRRLMLKIN
jgi:hypothetical protein